MPARKRSKARSTSCARATRLADLQLAVLGVTDEPTRNAARDVGAAWLMGEGPERAALLAEARGRQPRIDTRALPILLPAVSSTAIGRRGRSPWCCGGRHVGGATEDDVIIAGSAGLRSIVRAAGAALQSSGSVSWRAPWPLRSRACPRASTSRGSSWRASRTPSMTGASTCSGGPTAASDSRRFAGTSRMPASGRRLRTTPAPPMPRRRRP